MTAPISSSPRWAPSSRGQASKRKGTTAFYKNPETINRSTSKGGHGFGMRKQKVATDHWIERFAEWLEVLGLLNK